MTYDFLPTYPGAESLPEPSALFDSLWLAPLSLRGHLRFDPETGLVDFMGMQHSPAYLIGVRDVPGLGATATIRRSPGTHWAARGVRGTHPASVEVVLLGNYNAENRCWRYVELSHHEIGKNDAERAETAQSLMRRCNF